MAISKDKTFEKRAGGGQIHNRGCGVLLKNKAPYKEKGVKPVVLKIKFYNA